jgi:hypothetical protein
MGTPLTSRLDLSDPRSLEGGSRQAGKHHARHPWVPRLDDHPPWERSGGRWTTGQAERVGRRTPSASSADRSLTAARASVCVAAFKILATKADPTMTPSA